MLQKKTSIDAWCASLAIPQPMLDPGGATIKDLTDAIENRDKEIRTELVEFVRGLRVRVDINTPQAPSHSPVGATPPKSDTTAATNESVEPPVQPSEKDSSEEVTTTPARSGADVAGLRAAYAEDVAVRLIIDHFASRQYNQNITELDALRDKLDRTGTPVEKPSLIRAVRRLDACWVSDASSWVGEGSRRALNGMKNR